MLYSCPMPKLKRDFTPPSELCNHEKITVSVDDDTYHLAQAMASRCGMSVSGMLGEYLKNLTAGYKEPSHTAEKSLDEVIEGIFARGGGLDPKDNLSRDELYDRNAFR